VREAVGAPELTGEIKLSAARAPIRSLPRARAGQFTDALTRPA
jgi:hypothetical protein